MTDIAGKLARRLEGLDNHLAMALSIHLFVEHLLDKLIDERSPIAKKIQDDRRTYSFAVKLALVRHMDSISQGLFENLAGRNSLRNLYAHEIDVDLSHCFDKGFRRQDGSLLFGHPEEAVRAINDSPQGGIDVLLQIRDVTFGWLNDVVFPQGGSR